MTACLAGEVPAAKAAIASGASVNDKGKNKYGSVHTPLAAATSRQQMKLVRHLLGVGADPNGQDVMSSAVLSATPDILRLLLDAGGDLNKSNGRVLAPPVFATALAGGDVEAKLRLLLAEPGLDLTATFISGPEAFALSRDKPVVAAMIHDEVWRSRCKGVGAEIDVCVPIVCRRCVA